MTGSGTSRGGPGWGGALMRMRGLVRKETYQVVRDPSSIAIALVMPVILLLLFGYGVSLDAQDVPIAVVLENPTAEADALAAHFRLSRFFDVYSTTSMEAAEAAMRRREVDAIVRVPVDFGRRLEVPGAASVQLVLDGVDANRARVIAGYAQGAWQAWLRQRAQQAPGRAVVPPVMTQHRVWFNATTRSTDFLVPGIVALVMTLIGALLTAMVMAREWERGTMEALLVTPVRVREILLAKLVTYFALGLGGLALCVVMAVFLFDVPLRGSLWALTAASGLYLLVALGMGLLISSATRSQFVAGQTAIIATYLPVFFLSGFIFDIRSMPWPIQAITRVVPARYFVAMLHTLFLAGDVWSVLLPNGAALVIMAVVFLGLTRRMTRKRLE